MSRPRLLDLFCGAGGAAMGYYRAGFEVVGIDNRPMLHYPFEFYQADALEYCAEHGREFDVIHASPPCQGYSKETPESYKTNHLKLIPELRILLQSTNRCYVIENVEGARFELDNPTMLCGSMFGLNLWRHRYFEIWPARLLLTPSCRHDYIPVLVTGTAFRNGIKRDASKREKVDAIGIDWMTTCELDQAIPPAYTEWIGKQLMEHIYESI